ncbi:MAG: C2H2-type zinc finger protein, partial [Candidatus Thiodiazotropha taylori]|nr:C2H2-type zinc finger protein [Candidatus Thiodiazotropha taylori]MCW4334322.1 C2H2-type zinc finger protein [Candidatus Thiodiazotropha endolucinida]
MIEIRSYSIVAITRFIIIIFIITTAFFLSLCEAGSGEKRKHEEMDESESSSPPKQKRKFLYNPDNETLASYSLCDFIEEDLSRPNSPVSFSGSFYPSDLNDTHQSLSTPTLDLEVTRGACSTSFMSAVAQRVLNNNDESFLVTRRVDDSYRLSNQGDSELAVQLYSDDGMEQRFTVINSEKKTSDEAEDTYYCEPDSTTGSNGEQLIDISCLPLITSDNLAGNLKTHISDVHEKKKDHKCDQCQKEFNNPTSLSRHKKTHREGWQGWKCETCGKTFKNQPSLSSHKKTHREGWQGWKCE